MKVEMRDIKKDVEGSALFSGLNSFQLGKIYYMAPLNEVTMGFKYSENRSVESLAWNEDRSILTLLVKSLQVQFFLKDSKLSYECECSCWGSSFCAHIICGLITVKGLISPGILKGSSNADLFHREQLRGKLFLRNGKGKSIKKGSVQNKNPKSEKNNASLYLLLEPHPYIAGYFVVRVIKDGAKISPYSREVPLKLRQILETSYHNGIHESHMVAFFIEADIDMPVQVKVAGETFLSTWDHSLVVSSKTKLSLNQGTVVVEKLYVSMKDSSGELFPISNMLVVDVKEKKLGRVENIDGWVLWDFLSAAESMATCMVSETRIETSKKLFNEIQLSFDQKNRDRVLDTVEFFINKKPVRPKDAVSSLSMTVMQAENAQYVSHLNADCVIFGEKSNPTSALFSFFSMTASVLRGPLKAKKRRRIIVETLFALLQSKTKKSTEKIISNALSSQLFAGLNVKAEAKEFLCEFAKILYTNHERVVATKNAWSTVKADMKREGLLYLIPYRIFGWDIFDEVVALNKFFVLNEQLYERIHEMTTLLSSEGIEFYFDRKQVISSEWEFSFDASKKAELDWFEIKPEIKCDGKLVPMKEWVKILESNMLLEKGDQVKVLDAKSTSIINVLKGFLKPNKKNKPNKKDALTVSRLQILDWIGMRRMGVNLTLSGEDEELISRLFNFEEIEQKKIPKGIRATLRDYQKEGYYWLSFLYEHRFGACLADDMGLGKTIQAITLLSGLSEGEVKSPKEMHSRSHLIVVPPSLVFNWQHEIEKFSPDFIVKEYVGKERKMDFKPGEIILTTYDIVRRDIERLSEIDFHIIIFDEAQAIKNIIAERTTAVRQLKAYFKITMTGTPLENHLGEYYSILDLALPGLLDDYQVFQKYIKKEDPKDLERIIGRTRPFVLRRTKEKILKDLPPKVESDAYLQLSDHQKALYKRTVDMVKKEIDKAYSEKVGAQARIIALTAILRLRQICVHPGLVDPDHREPSPKIEYLLAKLEELREEGHSVLVFSQFTSFLDFLGGHLEKNKIAYQRMDGKTPMKKRKDLVNSFQNGKDPLVFILSLKTGGVGLNLTRASYVFHLDPWWNPAVENQATDRAHRIGQKNKVIITRILMHHTIEEKMMALKKKKQALFTALMDNGVERKAGGSITREDFNFLLQ